MSKGSSAPNPPSPSKVANAEAQANRVNQYTPQGNLIYGNTNAAGQFVQGPPNSNLQAASQQQETPFQSQLRTGNQNASLTLQGQVAPEAGHLTDASLTGLPAYQSSIDFSKVPGIPNPSDYGSMRDSATQAQYQRGYNLLQPDMQMQKRQLAQSLSDKGLPPGSEAYNTEMDRLDRSQQSQLENLSLSSVAAGSQEQQRLIQDQLQARGVGVGEQTTQMGLTNAARAAGYGERQSQRTQQLQELAAMLGGSYNPTPATAFAPANPINVSGAFANQYAGQQANYQAGQQQQAGILGALGSLGSAALLAYPFGGGGG